MDLSIVENLLECSICFERFDKTNRVLPCQHTFCYKCLSAVKSNFRELKCPECRTKYNGSIEDLPCNIFVIRILEQLKLNEKNADLMKSHKLKTIIHSSVSRSREINVIPAESIHALEQSMCKCVINHKKPEVFYCCSKIKNMFENQKHPTLITQNNTEMRLHPHSDGFIPNRSILKATRRRLNSDTSLNGVPLLPYKSTTGLQSTFPKVQSIYNEKPFLFTANSTYDNECQSALKAVNYHIHGSKHTLSSFTKLRNTFKEISRNSYNEKPFSFNANSTCESSGQPVLSVTRKHLESSLLLSKAPPFLCNSVIESQFSTKVGNSCMSKQLLSNSNINNKEEKLFVSKFNFNQKENAWVSKLDSVPKGKPFLFTSTSANEEKQFVTKPTITCERELFMFDTSCTSKQKSFLYNTKSTCEYNGQFSLKAAEKYLCETSISPSSSEVHSTDERKSFLFNTNTSIKEKSYIPRRFHTSEGNPFMFTSISHYEGKQLGLKFTSIDKETVLKSTSEEKLSLLKANSTIKEKDFLFNTDSTLKYERPFLKACRRNHKNTS